MATVAELTERYPNHLVPVLPAGPGVCSVCSSSVAGHGTCWQCSQHRRALPAQADAVMSIALAVKREQLAYELGAYKSSPSPAVRRQLRMQLAAVLWRWLDRHEGCVAAAAGAAAFDVVAVVPSSRGRTDHPLRDIACRMVVPTAPRYRDVLVLAQPPHDVEQHTARARMFQGTAEVDGRSVLLIDDTWTTGAHAQSGAAALKAAGAGPVAILALGRHFQPDQRGEHGEAAKAYLSAARQRGWSWRRCALCSGA